MHERPDGANTLRAKVRTDRVHCIDDLLAGFVSKTKMQIGGLSTRAQAIDKALGVFGISTFIDRCSLQR